MTPIIAASIAGLRGPGLTDEDREYFGDKTIEAQTAAAQAANFASDAQDSAAEASVTNGKIPGYAPADVAVALGVDANGKAAVVIETDGALSARKIRTDTINGVPVASLGGKPQGARYFQAEIVHLISYGQSLSIGVNGAATSPAQRYDSIRFNGGARPLDGSTVAATARSSFVPLIEQTVTGPAQNTPDTTLIAGETPLSGMTDMVKQLVLAEDGLAYTQQRFQLLGSAPGHGGRTVAQLSKGTGDYQVLADDLTFGASLAAAANRTYQIGAIAWTQGESDYLATTTAAAYTATFGQLVNDMRADAVAASGQPIAPIVITYQVASHRTAGVDHPNIALAQLAYAEANPIKAILACPMYPFTYSDGFHMTGQSYKLYGAYLGLAYKRAVVDQTPWSPLKPISVFKQGRQALVRFKVPFGDLKFDTTQVTATSNMGFELVSSTNTALAISSVEIVGPDLVKVTAASTIPAGAKLRYAHHGDGGGNVGSVNGPRGNLRDSQGDSLIFDGGSFTRRLDNWCVIFELAL